jgi:hypothetical protein
LTNYIGKKNKKLGKGCDEIREGNGENFIHDELKEC